MKSAVHGYDQVVYLLQGGGALGSFQAGVVEALVQNDLNPDWVVGTSIGGVNAAIIAGNPPEQRLAKLKEFWDRVSSPVPFFPAIKDTNEAVQECINNYCAIVIALFGVPAFFRPRFNYSWLMGARTPDEISFYNTDALRKTLLDVIDFDLINKKPIRLSLGAVNVRTGQPVHFDNFRHIIRPEHVMACGALPPGFPAVKIDEEYYWDGGVISNTPFSVVLEERIPQKLLCFIVNLFTYPNQIPTSMMSVMKVKKELEYASRHHEVLHSFCELHFLQHAIELLAKTADKDQDLAHVLKIIKQTGHPTSLNIIQFHYQDRPCNLWSKDFNFSFQAIDEHWQAGCRNVQEALKKPGWLKWDIDDEWGAVIHEF